MVGFQSLVTELRDLIQRFGLAYVFNRYYSVYRAKVIDNADPEGRGRVRVTCPAVSRKGVLDWAPSVSHLGGKQRGLFFPPDVDDFVWVMFEEGDPRCPIYIGGWWGVDELGPDFKPEADGDKLKPPTVRGIQTPSGHKLVFTDTEGKEAVLLATKGGHQLSMSDVPGEEAVRLIWKNAEGKAAFLSFEKSGAFMVMNKAGSMLSMDPEAKTFALVDENGNTVAMDPKGIKVVDKDGNLFSLDGGEASLMTKGNVSVVAKAANLKTGSVTLCDGAAMSGVLGEMLMAWLSAHIHPTGVGPSGPPIMPPPPTILSKHVKLK